MWTILTHIYIDIKYLRISLISVCYPTMTKRARDNWQIINMLCLLTLVGGMYLASLCYEHWTCELSLHFFAGKVIHHNPQLPGLPVHALLILNHDRTDHNTNSVEHWCMVTVAWSSYYCVIHNNQCSGYWLSVSYWLGLPSLVQLLTWLHYWITIIFQTPKNGSLKINSLPSNNCFSYRNVLQNGINALSKMGLKNSFFFFCPKAQIMYRPILDHMICFKISQHIVQIRIK